MNKQKIDELEQEFLKRLKVREKIKKRKMKVSGSGVKKLQKIIIAK